MATPQAPPLRLNPITSPNWPYAALARCIVELRQFASEYAEPAAHGIAVSAENESWVTNAFHDLQGALEGIEEHVPDAAAWDKLREIDIIAINLVNGQVRTCKDTVIMNLKVVLSAAKVLLDSLTDETGNEVGQAFHESAKAADELRDIGLYQYIKSRDGAMLPEFTPPAVRNFGFRSAFLASRSFTWSVTLQEALSQDSFRLRKTIMKTLAASHNRVGTGAGGLLQALLDEGLRDGRDGAIWPELDPHTQRIILNQVLHLHIMTAAARSGQATGNLFQDFRKVGDSHSANALGRALLSPRQHAVYSRQGGSALPVISRMG
ncbi:hypothetical protein JCM10908_007096 [Rhodotorula pacifica]|uniref:uncharacterized protein n=1 Tax=Rhodotorula pacifica TaxID=1495444 RepID=UPI00317DBD54